MPIRFLLELARKFTQGRQTNLQSIPLFCGSDVQSRTGSGETPDNFSWYDNAHGTAPQGECIVVDDDAVVDAQFGARGVSRRSQALLRFNGLLLGQRMPDALASGESAGKTAARHACLLPDERGEVRAKKRSPGDDLQLRGLFRGYLAKTRRSFRISI